MHSLFILISPFLLISGLVLYKKHKRKLILQEISLSETDFYAFGKQPNKVNGIIYYSLFVILSLICIMFIFAAGYALLIEGEFVKVVGIILVILAIIYACNVLYNKGKKNFSINYDIWAVSSEGLTIGTFPSDKKLLSTYPKKLNDINSFFKDIPNTSRIGINQISRVLVETSSSSGYKSLKISTDNAKRELLINDPLLGHHMLYNILFGLKNVYKNVTGESLTVGYKDE